MINKPFTFTNKPFSPQNSVVVNIIWANVIVYFVFLILGFFPFGRTLFDLFSFNPHQPLYISFYSLVTNIFLHAGFMHLLGNMLWLYFVGTILEDLIGSKHIIRLFFFGGILGAFFFYIFAQITGISGLLVGASGGIAALLIATALFAPNYRVFLLGIVEIELRWIVIIKIFFDVMGLLFAYNIGGNLAHIGGYLFGLAYITEIKGMWNFPKFNNTRFKSKPKRTATVNINNSKSPSQEEIDAILDKISANGYDSLTAKEKEKLFSASKK
jgi:membrane associated rhomboid family serine protease